MGDMGLPGPIIDERDYLTINLERAIGRLKQSHDDIEQSAFTAASGSNDADLTPNMEKEVLVASRTVRFYSTSIVRFYYYH